MISCCLVILVKQYGDLRLQKAQKPKTLQEDGDKDSSMTSRNIEGVPGFRSLLFFKILQLCHAKAWRMVPSLAVSVPGRTLPYFGVTTNDSSAHSLGSGFASGSSLTLGLAGQ